MSGGANQPAGDRQTPFCGLIVPEREVLQGLARVEVGSLHAARK